MSYMERIDSIINNLDTGGSTFNVRVNDGYIRVMDSEWNPTFDEGFYEHHLADVVSRKFNRTDKKYEIDKDKTYNGMRDAMLSDLRAIFSQCSPAKEASRTKVFKSFFATVNENKGKIEFMNSLFDISEYFYNVGEDDATEINDVHRKNIYQLFCLMEKNYAKRKTNSN